MLIFSLSGIESKPSTKEGKALSEAPPTLIKLDWLLTPNNKTLSIVWWSKKGLPKVFLTLFLAVHLATVQLARGEVNHKNLFLKKHIRPILGLFQNKKGSIPWKMLRHCGWKGRISSSMLIISKLTWERRKKDWEFSINILIKWTSIAVSFPKLTSKMRRKYWSLMMRFENCANNNFSKKRKV